MPYKSVKAIVYAVLLWIIGFVWGSIVFMNPALKNVAAVPYVSRNPAISFPLLIVGIILAYLLAKSYLKATPDKEAEGLKLGITFFVGNVVLDLLVLVLALKLGLGYFVSVTVWVGYFLLLLVPWLVGRSLQRASIA